MDIYNSHIPNLFQPRKAPNWAVTIGPIAFYAIPEEQVPEAWRRHEDCHKRQWRQYWYIGFLILYLWQILRYGYRDAPFEMAARAAEDVPGIV